MPKSKLTPSEPPIAIADDRSARHAFYVIAVMWGIGVAATLMRALAPVLLLMPLAIAGWVWRQRWLIQHRQQLALQAVFYQLIQDYQGQVTLLDLAMGAKVDAAIAQPFLDARAQEFAAQFAVSETGDVVYLFATLRSLSSVSFAPAASANTTVSAENEPDRSLTQADLARRLGVSASTLSRKKLAADLTTWSRERDPERCGWAYLVQMQRFLKLD